MKKATLTTVKSFIKKNANNLYMMKQYTLNERKIDPAKIDLNAKDLGIDGVFISPIKSQNFYYETENGISISNLISGCTIYTK